jgi:hypothetical protein
MNASINKYNTMKFDIFMTIGSTCVIVGSIGLLYLSNDVNDTYDTYDTYDTDNTYHIFPPMFLY